MAELILPLMVVYLVLGVRRTDMYRMTIRRNVA